MSSSRSLTEGLRRYSGVERDVAEAILEQALPKLREIAVRELERRGWGAHFVDQRFAWEEADTIPIRRRLCGSECCWKCWKSEAGICAGGRPALFAGFTLEEIGGNTDLSVRQIRLRWSEGRDWLKDRL